jgi:hypothetical protein
MSEQQSLSGVFLGLGGGVVTSLGVAGSAVGTLFAVHKLSGGGIAVLQALPRWFGVSATPQPSENHDDESKQAQPAITKEAVGRELGMYSKIGLLIVAGVALRYAGNKMSSPEASATFNNLLTGNFK